MVQVEGSLPPFFSRHGLDIADWTKCRQFVEAQYPGHIINSDVSQGGCSWTVLAVPRPGCSQQDGETPRPAVQDEQMVVQIRPQCYALSIQTAALAKQWYGELVPSVTEIGRLEGGSQNTGLLAYRLSYIPGKRFDDLQAVQLNLLDPGSISKYRLLLDSFADFHACAWRQGVLRRQCGDQLHCIGKVGSSILQRLRKLEDELPSCHLRSKAARARAGVEAGLLDRLPIVFTHGDLLPSNILVDTQTWHINGFIDWTESEYLPFGMSLYGFEHLLGRLISWGSFCYIKAAEGLRQFLWRQLTRCIPDLRRWDIREAVELARVVGILLWRGFAWDDGRIDRVVDPVRDDEELAYLEAFLSTRITSAVARL